jgi:polar amino acid transport system substrate-binding protein
MSKSLLPVAALLVAAWLLLASSYTLAEPIPLTVAGSTWSPYTDVDRPGKGVAAEIVTVALGRAGYAPKIVIEPWPRTLEGTRIGVYDAIIAAFHTLEREERFAFSRPYLRNEVRFIKRKGQRIDFQNLGDLKGLLIGVVRGYAYQDDFDTARGLIKVQHNHVIQNLLKLTQGQLDLTLDDRWTLLYEIGQYMPNEASELEFLPKPLAVRPLHFIVSRQNPNHEKIVADFDAAFASMQSDGTLDQIIDRHLKDLAHLQEQAP